MIALIGTVLLGAIFAIFATQNTTAVSLNFGGHVLSNTPLYLVVLVPLLIGLLLAFLLHTIKDLSSSLTLSGEKDKVKKLKEELAGITKEAHKLELENTKLKAQTGQAPDENSI